MKLKVGDGLLSALDVAGLESKVKTIVSNNATSMQNKAKGMAPVDTGHLRSGISVNATDGGYGMKVVSLATYSVFVEYGTRFQSAQPFIVPAFNQQKPIFLNEIKQAIK